MKQPQMTARFMVAVVALIVSTPLSAQDRYTLKSPNGIAFSEFKGYGDWQVIASSQPDDAGGCGTTKLPCIKSIMGNPVMIKAYQDGFPANGKAVPDGAAMAKVEWTSVKDSHSPYGVTVPGVLTGIAFMMKDSKRFPETNGWGYAALLYDASTKKFMANSKDASFAQACHACHIAGATKTRDFVYTDYAKR